MPPHVVFTLQSLRLLWSALSSPNAEIARLCVEEQLQNFASAGFARSRDINTRAVTPTWPHLESSRSVATPDSAIHTVCTADWVARCHRQPGVATTSSPHSLPQPLPPVSQYRSPTSWVAGNIAVLDGCGLVDLADQLLDSGRLPDSLRVHSEWKQVVNHAMVRASARADYEIIAESSRSRVTFLLTTPPDLQAMSGRIKPPRAWDSTRVSQLRSISHLRAGNHTLRIQVDRGAVDELGNPLPPSKRTCRKCALSPEDEGHFVSFCPCYESRRLALMQSWKSVIEAETSIPAPIKTEMVKFVSRMSRLEFFATALGADPSSPIVTSHFSSSSRRLVFSQLHRRINRGPSVMAKMLVKSEKAIKSMLGDRDCIPSIFAPASTLVVAELDIRDATNSNGGNPLLQ